MIVDGLLKCAQNKNRYILIQTQVASDLSVFIEQVVFLLRFVVSLVKDTMEEYLEDWKKVQTFMRDWMHYLDRTFEGKSGDAIFVGVSFVAGGLNIWGCIPMSVIWGFGMLGGRGGLIITCRQKTSTLRLDIGIFYLELFVWEPPIPIFVSIVPHFLHIFIRHLSGEILHDVDKVLLHSIKFQIQSCNVILSAKIIGTMGHCTARYLSQKVCWRVIGMRLDLT